MTDQQVAGAPTRCRRLIVVGLGLIGGSLVASLRKRDEQSGGAAFAEKYLGLLQDDASCAKACELGLVDHAFTSLSALETKLGLVGEDDIIFLAVPTLATASVLPALKDAVERGAVLTDGASVKGSVVSDYRAHLNCAALHNVVPGHPIAGSEKSGFDAIDPDLYKAHRIILTPLPETSSDALDRVQRLWIEVGGEPVSMAVDEHDEVLAATSHLPHLIAFSLVDTLAHDSQNANIFRYAAGGFRDFTRIASSDAVMWRDIMLSNKEEVLKATALFRENLARLENAIQNDDHHGITGVFTRAKAARDRFTAMLSQQSFTHSHALMTQQSATDKQSAELKASNTLTFDSPTKSRSSLMLNYNAQPGGSVQGTIRVPGDKSISHRSIMLGSLAEGKTEISGFLEGEDALATLQCFRDMGVVIEGPDKGKVTVHGVGLSGLKEPQGELYVGNSGTSMRLLAGILAGQSFSTTMTGDVSLNKRPMGRVAEPLTSMGAAVKTAANGRPPLIITGGQSLSGFHYEMPIASAQVKSCLLLAGLYAKDAVSVTEPAPTRDHTERMLAGFGYPVERKGSKATITPGGKLKATTIDVPADISSATFFLVAAAITEGSDLTLTHVGINPTRIGVLNILRLMGANIALSDEREVGGEPVADIRIRYAPLKGIDVPEDQVPLAIDEFPAIFIAAACANGTTRVSGAEELRVKETDRIQAMIDGLKTLGCDCEATADGAIIKGGSLGGGHINSQHDHRIAMSFAIASLRANAPIVIEDCANVSTSFPNFIELARQVGLRVHEVQAQ